MDGGRAQHGSVATRQWLQKQFQSSGIQIDSASLKQLAKTIEATTNPEDLLAALLDEIETSMFGCVPNCCEWDRCKNEGALFIYGLFVQIRMIVN